MFKCHVQHSKIDLKQSVGMKLMSGEFSTFRIEFKTDGRKSIDENLSNMNEVHAIP